MKDNVATSLGKVVYSQDVTKIPKWFVQNSINKFRSKDFGEVDSNVAERFRIHYDISDKDIYGVYMTNNPKDPDEGVVVYYDAKEDKIFVITREEFIYFYPKDWIDRSQGVYYMAQGGNKRTTENKKGTKSSEGASQEKTTKSSEGASQEGSNSKEFTIKSRTRTAREPGLRQKEGQNREIIKNYMSTVGTNPGRELFMAHKVTPIQEYSEIAKMLTADELEQFKKVAEEVGVPLKKILQEFTYQLRVSWLPKPEAIDRTLKNARQRYFSTKDSLDEEKDYPYVVQMLNYDTKEVFEHKGYNLSKVIRDLYKERVDNKAKHPIEKILDGVDDVYEIKVIKKGER